MDEKLKATYDRAREALWELQQHYNEQSETPEKGLLCPNRESRDIYDLRVKLLEMARAEKAKPVATVRPDIHTKYPLPKVWHLTLKSGSVIQISACNASEIVETAAVKDGDVMRATRLLYDDGKPLVESDRAVNEAVRTLIETTGKTGRSLCLLTNEGEAPFILPALINGAIEYQVSDGIDGDRCTSYDAYSWSEAIANFEVMRADLTKA